MAELELELAQSKAMVSEMSGLLFALSCGAGLIGILGFTGSQGPLSLLGELTGR